MPWNLTRLLGSHCQAHGRQWLHRLVSLWFWLSAIGSCSAPANASLQFDVFLGYDGMVREAAWFPLACEVFNDGPSFNAVIEISSGNIGSDEVCRIPLELPTNTRKRLIVPVFASGARISQWNARLLDERGKVHADRPSLQPKTVAWEGALLGALPRSFAGLPTLPEGRQNRPDSKPQVARLQVDQFPDNPIALEALDALYLNSEKALSLKANQITALLAWLQEGGRLIVSVEQLADVNSTPWLQQLVPVELSAMTNAPVEQDLQAWVQQALPADRTPTRPSRLPSRVRGRAAVPSNPIDDLSPDPNFANAHLPVASGTLRDGTVLLAAKEYPLIVEASRGRGQVALLTFSPEREPFRSWKHRAWFWSKLMEIPAAQYLSSDFSPYGGWSLDGVFGALIDSRQLRKLPVEWLLLLLVVYLVVIGPFDQYWLKKINRQMLTWITFPTYVVLFSLLIYFIGYKLRAGETEWNELQIVDVVPRGQKTAWRGRTFASIYSASNARYALAYTPASPQAADQSFSCLRGELLDLYSGGQEASHANVEQVGNGFRADIFVPVWTSLLYVNDWFQPGILPLAASMTNAPTGTSITVENHLDRPLTEARVVWKGSVFELGTLEPRQKRSVALDASAGIPLQSFVVQYGARFQDAVRYRRNPLGDANQGHLENLPATAMAASFPRQIPGAENQRIFVWPPGLDLSREVDRGDAILLAWDANHGYANPINQFKPPRLQRNTLLRLAVPGA